MGCGGTVDYLVDTVLNYPTLSEAYKVAALDATNKIRAVHMFTGESGRAADPDEREPTAESWCGSTGRSWHRLVADPVPVQPRARVHGRAAPGSAPPCAGAARWSGRGCRPRRSPRPGHLLADPHERRLMCPYVVIVPSSWRTRTHSPKPLAGPESTTVPGSGTRIGVPIGAAMSMPLCERAPARAEARGHPPARPSARRRGGVGAGGGAGGRPGSAGRSARGAASAARAAAAARACRSAAFTSSETPTTGGSAAEGNSATDRGGGRAGRRPRRPSRVGGVDGGLDTGRGGLPLDQLLHAELEHVRAVVATGSARVRAAWPAAARAPPARRRDDSRPDNGACGRRAEDATAATCSPLPPRRAAAGARGVCAGPGGSGAVPLPFLPDPPARPDVPRGWVGPHRGLRSVSGL